MPAGADSDPIHRCQFRMYLGVDLSPSAPHSAPIQTLATDENLIFTGSRDGTIKEWNLDMNQYKCLGTFRGHTDWVTDLHLYQKSVISASSDKSIRIWDRDTGRSVSTSRWHCDYVECIDIAPETDRLVSGGLDNQLYLWDLHDISQPIHQLHQGANCASIYSVYMNENLIFTGSSDKIIRIWDSRNGDLIDTLSGHQGNIRCVLGRRGDRCLISGSSDGCVRIWDIGQRKCINMFSPLTKQPIWTVASDVSMSNIYAGGRSDQITCIDIEKGQTSLVATMSQSLYCLRLHLNPSETGLHIASSDTNLSFIDVSQLQRTESHLDPNVFDDQTSTKGVIYACPPCRNTQLNIAGRPSIVAAVSLNDGRRICTKNGCGEIEIWDIVEQKKVASCGKTTVEEIVQRYNTDISVPNWFSIDLHLGALGIVLQRSSAFNAEIWTQPTQGTRPRQVKFGLHKVNLGAMALENALKIWVSVLSQNRDESGDAPQTLLRVSESPHSVAVDPGTDGEKLLSPLPEPNQPVPSPKHALGTRVGDFETELDCLIMTQQLIGTSAALFRILNLYDPKEYDEIVTPWVRAWVTEGILPAIRRSELRFEVQPHPDDDRLPPMSVGTWMKADESVTVRHLSAYIIQQLPAITDEIQSYQSGNDADHPEHILSIICQDQVLEPGTSLRTARSFAWKNKKLPFTLLYRLRNN